MAVVINGKQRIYARDAVITNGVVVGDESVEPSQAIQVIQGPSSLATPYLKVKSTHPSQPNSKIFLADDTNNVGELAIWADHFYHVANVSGAHHIFQVHDTTGLKSVLQIYATSTIRYLDFGDGTNSAEIWANSGGSTTTAGLVLRSDTKHRWQLQHNNTAESGSNAGSDFALHAYDDSGTWLSNPLVITRSNGGVLFNQSGSPAYFDLRNNNASEDTRIRFLDNTGAYRGQLAMDSSDAYWITSNISGGHVYVQTHDTSSVVIAGDFYSSSSNRYLRIGDGNVAATLRIIGAAGNTRYVRFDTSSTVRWQMGADSGSESGSNAGSEFKLLAYSDAGAALGHGFIATRAQPDFTFIGNSSATYTSVYIRSMNSTSGARIVLKNSSNADLADFTVYDDTLYSYNRIGGSWYFGVDDGGGDTQMMRLYANSTDQQINLGDGTVATTLYINGAAAKYRLLQYQTNGSVRWQIGANDSTESGSNAGSDFNIYRYSDAGSYIDAALSIIRSTGHVWANVGLYSGGDIWSDAWTSYGGSSTVDGWSSRSYTNIYYKKIGNFMFVNFSISGQSDDTIVTFTLPTSYTGATIGTTFTFRAYDNSGTYTIGVGEIAASGYTVQLWKDPQKNDWTGGNTVKAVFGSFTYEAST